MVKQRLAAGVSDDALDAAYEEYVASHGDSAPSDEEMVKAHEEYVAYHGFSENTGDTYPVCEACGDIGGIGDEEEPCRKCNPGGTH